MQEKLEWNCLENMDRKFKYSFQFHFIFFWKYIRKPKNSEIGNVISCFNFGKNIIRFQKFRTLEHPYTWSIDLVI